MKRDNYIALISSMDDFGLAQGEDEDVVDVMLYAYIEKEDWVSAHPFDVPAGTDEELVTLVARGLFWENDWSMDDSVSCVVRDNSDLDDFKAEHAVAKEVDPQDDIEDEEIIITATVR